MIRLRCLLALCSCAALANETDGGASFFDLGSVHEVGRSNITREMFLQVHELRTQRRRDPVDKLPRSCACEADENRTETQRACFTDLTSSSFDRHAYSTLSRASEAQKECFVASFWRWLRDLHGRCWLTVRLPGDGAGSQLGHQLYGVIIAELFGCEFVHTPITNQATWNMVIWDFPPPVGQTYCHFNEVLVIDGRSITSGKDPNYTPSAAAGVLHCYRVDWEAWTRLNTSSAAPPPQNSSSSPHPGAAFSSPSQECPLYWGINEQRMPLCDPRFWSLSSNDAVWLLNLLGAAASVATRPAGPSPPTLPDRSGRQQLRGHLRAAWERACERLRRARASAAVSVDGAATTPPSPSEDVGRAGHRLHVVVHVRGGDVFSMRRISTPYFFTIARALHELARRADVAVRFSVVGELPGARPNRTTFARAFPMLRDFAVHDGVLSAALAETTTMRPPFPRIECFFNGNPAFALDLMTRADVLVLSCSMMSYVGLAFGSASLAVLPPLRYTQPLGTFGALDPFLVGEEFEDKRSNGGGGRASVFRVPELDTPIECLLASEDLRGKLTRAAATAGFAVNDSLAGSFANRPMRECARAQSGAPAGTPLRSHRHRSHQPRRPPPQLRNDSQSAIVLQRARPEQATAIRRERNDARLRAPLAQPAGARRFLASVGRLLVFAAGAASLFVVVVVVS